MSAPAYHALGVRVPATANPDLLARRYEAIVHRRADLDVPATLWTEQVPAAVAERRLDAELALPASRGLRAALLCGADGHDLVLVADRAIASRRDLDLLAAAVTGGAGSDPDRSGAPTATAAPAVTTAVPSWGLGGTAGGTGEIAIDPWAADAEPAAWSASLAIVLQRYGDTALATVLDTIAVRHVAPQDPAAATVEQLVESFRSPARPTDEPVSVGIVFDADAPTGGRYLAWLAPPFPLTIGVGRARLHYEHQAGIDPGMAAQFARHLVTVHQQVVKLPGLPVTALDLFDEAERRRIVALGGRALPPTEAAPQRIEDVFAARAAEHPDVIALCFQQERITYRELDIMSTRIAAGLRRSGVRAGDRVGICLDRSAHLVATMLAVLKAGGVYVPMDPFYPAERLAYTTDDAGLAVVVTVHEEFPTGSGPRLATPDELAALDAAGAADDGPAGEPADPAYVIYTSGSTGRPKGVVVPHANVLALLAATRDDFRLGPADVWTLFHSSVFDFSVWEIWGCLLTGGRLVVVPYWISRSPEEFRDLLVDEQVTVLNQTPSAFSQLLAVDRTQQGPLPVRLLVFGGESLDTRMLLPWFDRHPGTRAVNMFGITETTVHVTAETVTRALALGASRSVGRAIPGWHLHVLGPDGALLPPGLTGEIYVGGAGVALGYLERPELDEERFLDNPFGPGRLYRSGDAGRLRPDGRLEHLGRIDSQVKVRGFRIELDEIRSVLLEDRAVVAATVVVRDGDAATVGIDAYVVLDGSSAEEVRKRVGRILPDYMIPTTVTAVAVLPLTANGKIDVRRLPPPAMPSTGRARTAIPPSDDELVEGLQEVWSTVLGIPVGPDDDFFELGGNSLLAVRIAAESRERGLPTTSFRTLYRHLTIRRVAEAARTESLN